MKRTSSCETHFLGWDAPLLPAATHFLADRYSDSGRVDLGCLICVLPTSRSKGTIDRLLRAEASLRTLEYVPPQILTIGQLAESLYSPEIPIALELEQTLAWARVLQRIPADDLKPLIPIVPEPELVGPWIDFGGTLRRLHEELSADRLTFDDVRQGTETEGEQRRWKLLSAIFDSYLSELADANLSDPHVARRLAIEANQCRTDQTIILIGTSDLSGAMIEMLQTIETTVQSLVAAPTGQSSRFDRFGCVKTKEWLEHHLPVCDQHFVAADDISDQAQAVAESISHFRDTLSSGDIAVGVTDESQVGPVEVELRGCGFSSYRHLGWTLSETAIGRLMGLIAIHLRRQTWQSFAALVRHGDVCAMVSKELEIESSDWLTHLDQLLADHYPVRLVDALPSKALSNSHVANQVAKLIESWLGDFSRPKGTISQWSRIFEQCLQALYKDRIDRSDRSRTATAVDAACRLLDRFAELNSHLDMSIDSAAAMEMLAARVSDVRIGEVLQEDDIQIAGWLDLALDTSDALIVVGLNHPFVPAAVTADPFLPGSLRTKLRMADNDRRYARDVYAMHLMVTTRSKTRFIIGRFSADGSPTPPSRLLAAAPPADSARRVLQILKKSRKRRTIDHRWNEGPDQSRLPIPKIVISDESAPIKSMSVTAFHDYLICPYRFYLRHVLKCRPLDDDGRELAANQFGDLIHDALDRFGNSPERDESNGERIEKLLLGHLRDYADEQYGSSVTTAVTLQVKQAERRLKVVAMRQAQRVADGWRIRRAEESAGEKEGSGIEVDGQWMTLKGRFDRIDYHPESKRWAILDYKTHADPPKRKHLKKSATGYQWIDLQLPLYRMMIPFLGIDADPTEVQLGYFNIAQKEIETKINIADFGEELMSQADELIVDCIRNIWAGRFEPTNDPVMYDDYAMILQTGVAGSLLGDSLTDDGGTE